MFSPLVRGSVVVDVGVGGLTNSGIEHSPEAFIASVKLLFPLKMNTEVLNGGSGGGYPTSGPKLNSNGSGVS